MKTMKLVEETHRNKNRMFLLCFLSTDVYRLDMLVHMIPKSFAKSIKRNCVSGFSQEVPFVKRRECNFRVRGAKRANTLITYFVSSMPQVKCDIYSASYAS